MIVGDEMTEEENRLNEARAQHIPWRKWGPYLSERQWGTVREDYSSDGAAWDYFSHDQARSRAYRWGEDGIAGISDDRQLLCFALAFWNGHDQILKERMFGLTNNEGNHGEDVKEYYFYLDSTPTHSFMRMLYKYPHAEYPYAQLVQNNRDRTRSMPEYELLDTGIFDDDRYFDIEIAYAKSSPTDILIEIIIHNRSSEAASLDILPTLWFRNTWSWGENSERSRINVRDGKIVAENIDIGEYILTCDRDVPFLFTDNETNTERLFGVNNTSRYVKDGINAAIVNGDMSAINPKNEGSKVAAHYHLDIDGNASQKIRLRLAASPEGGDAFGPSFTALVEARKTEADAFYAALLPANTDPDRQMVFRQALAGMLWSKQFYNLDMLVWLREHGIEHPERKQANTRNIDWSHVINGDIISMPDKWEYPWYAAWDLAFHTVPLALVDPDFAKSQLSLLLRDDYLHPNGQMPAYEWNFGDVNPPVHAWSVMFVYEVEKQTRGQGDFVFLQQAFNKLLLNFNWWLNQKDPSGRNVFEGGFLGLDNIGVFDRNAVLPTGDHLEQADGTAWMTLYCQAMLQIAVELSEHDVAYEAFALQFIEHFCRIAGAINWSGEDGRHMWDEEDGFYYDVLRLPDGSGVRLKTRSLVGLLPLCATVVIEGAAIERNPAFLKRVQTYLARHPTTAHTMAPLSRVGAQNRRMLSVVDEDRLRRILSRLLDPNEFLGDHGIRSVSRWHEAQPYAFRIEDVEYQLRYEPAESGSGLFGGNSNWRGPVWFPINALLIRALRQYYLFYGDDFVIEFPTGSGVQKNLYEISEAIAQRLITIFTRDEHGKRPVFGGADKFQMDAHWQNNLLFYEYFHGDNGAGIGASHQTGWTGLVAALISLYSGTNASEFLKTGSAAAVATFIAGRKAPNVAP
jgi:hypothetical protein